MILRLPRNFIFPLATLAFIALPVAYADLIFTPTTRWVFLSGLVLYLLAKRRITSGFRSPFGLMLLLYCTWCVSTYSWSEVPQLSLEKAVAFAVVAVAFVSAGQEWVDERGKLKALTYLAPVSVIALFAGATGRFDSVDTTRQHGMELYQGLTDNPNMLGSLIVMALPLLLWSAYKFRKGPKARWFWFALVTIAALLLIRTYARSAILSAGMLGLGFCLSLRLPKKGFVLVLIAAALLFAAALSTTLLDTGYKQYVLKGGTETEGILYSRSDVWQQSYENAEQGGWFGAGYGVTIGDTSFQGGATAVGYGREKGNTQLAIVEETGVVGLGLYAAMLFALFVQLISAHRRERTPDIKVALGIITGALAGLTVMSVFEAWWVAPGSAESAYFWSLAGVGLGLTQRPARAAATVDDRRLTQGGILQSVRFVPERKLGTD